MGNLFFHLGIILFVSLESGTKGSHKLGKVCVSRLT